MTTIKRFDTLSLIILIALIGIDLIFWSKMLGGRLPRFGDYFLDVGQGDGELIIFPNGIRVMTDAGPDSKVVDSLSKVLAADDHYIDIATISHPQLDHFNGYNYMLDAGYHFGAFVYNGRDDEPPIKEWTGLLQKIRDAGIPLITLARGDRIHIIRSHGGKAASVGEIAFFSPNGGFLQSAELNDTAFVELAVMAGLRTLLTADAGMNVENFLLRTGADLHADVLKVGHHGSNYSSGDAFLRVVNPKMAVIEVGARNTYGHPGKAALARLASSTHAAIFRTDMSGTIAIFPGDGRLVVTKEK